MKKNIMHDDLVASGRWFQMPLVEQLGNIGSEVSRAVSWKKRGEKTHQTYALDRALELFDLTLSDKRWRGRLKEIARAREVVVDYLFGDNVYQTTPEFLEKYFYYFAYAARNKPG